LKKVFKADAKINLSLDVLNRREDGYHEVSMIMQEIDLFDEVQIEAAGKTRAAEPSIILNVLGNQNIPSDETNTAYKAAKILMEKYSISENIKVDIIKHIPQEAGMAGGSTDAAAVIRGINEIFNLGMTLQEMFEVGKKIGADVPYCIMGGTALAEGIGEQLTALKNFSGVNIIIAKPYFGISTQYVYKNLDLNNLGKRPDNKELIKYIENGDISGLAKNMSNVMETVTAKRYKEIKEIENILIENGAAGSIMTGSGTTVFGIFENYEAAQKAYNSIKSTSDKLIEHLFLTKTV
jgi:4-diphosphocytidyl-2-C-methyl-D-erythritol kinase